MIQEPVEIGTKLLFRAMLFVVGIFFLYLIRDVVLLVLLAVLTAAALAPAILKLRRWFGFSRTAAVVVVYSILFFGGVALLVFLVPLFFSEVKQFLQNWPAYALRLNDFLIGLEGYFSGIGLEFSKQDLFANMESGVTNWFGNLFSTTVNVFQGMIHFIGYFFLALYLSIEERGIEKFFLLLAPEQYHKHALSIASRMREKVSQWLFGQMLLMAIAFGMYYIGLSALGVPYALAIAFFGGLMEIIPYLGPILAAIPAIIVGLLYSPTLGLSALVFYIVAHQIEAHIVAPQVMKHSAGLNPVALIVAILIGSELGGPLGIILAVPVTMMLSVFVEDLMIKRQG